MCEHSELCVESRRNIVIKIIVMGTNLLRVPIPGDLQLQAPLLLAPIWRDEFANTSDIIVEMTEPVKQFVETALLNRHILVYV